MILAVRQQSIGCNFTFSSTVIEGAQKWDMTRHKSVARIVGSSTTRTVSASAAILIAQTELSLCCTGSGKNATHKTKIHSHCTSFFFFLGGGGGGGEEGMGRGVFE